MQKIWVPLFCKGGPTLTEPRLSPNPSWGSGLQGKAPWQPAGPSKPFDLPEVWACLSYPRPGKGKPMEEQGSVIHMGRRLAAPEGGAAGGGFSGLSTHPAGGQGPHTQLWPGAGCGLPWAAFPSLAPRGRGKPSPGVPRRRLTCWDTAPICLAQTCMPGPLGRLGLRSSLLSCWAASASLHTPPLSWALWLLSVPARPVPITARLQSKAGELGMALHQVWPAPGLMAGPTVH